MTELSGNTVRMLSAEAALLPSQRAIHQANRELMEGAHYARTTVDYLVPGVDPVATREELRTTVPDMFVAVGAVLLPDAHLADYPYDAARFPHMRPGIDAVAESVSISTWGVHTEKKRRFEASREPEFTAPDTHIVNFGDEILVEWFRKYEWNGNVGVSFWYGQGDVRVGERLSVVTDHGWPGRLPMVESRVAIANSDSHIAYPRAERPARDDTEVMRILSFIRQLNMLTRAVQ